MQLGNIFRNINKSFNVWPLIFKLALKNLMKNNNDFSSYKYNYSTNILQSQRYPNEQQSFKIMNFIDKSSNPLENKDLRSYNAVFNGNNYKIRILVRLVLYNLSFNSI